MIDNTSIANPTLNFDQLQAIDVVQKRLVNLESEISIATKNLKIVKGDSERAVKDKEYQNELLAAVSSQVKEKSEKATALDEELLVKSDILAKLNSEIATKSVAQTAKDMEFKDREDTIYSKELQISAQGNSIGKERILLNNEKAEFNAKVAKLKEVINTF